MTIAKTDVSIYQNSACFKFADISLTKAKAQFMIQSAITEQPFTKQRSLIGGRAGEELRSGHSIYHSRSIEKRGSLFFS